MELSEDEVLLNADELDEGTAVPLHGSPRQSQIHEPMSPPKHDQPEEPNVDESGRDISPPRSPVRSPNRPPLQRDTWLQPPGLGVSNDEAADNAGTKVASPGEEVPLAQLQAAMIDPPSHDRNTYAYTHADLPPMESELDEWFQYTRQDTLLIKSFLVDDSESGDAKTETEIAERKLKSLEDVQHQLLRISSPESGAERDAVHRICSLGWAVRNEHYMKSFVVELLKHGGLARLFKCLSKQLDALSISDSEFQQDADQVKESQSTLSDILSIFYLVIVFAAYLDADSQELVRIEISKLSLSSYLAQSIASLRWDETLDLPITHFVQLLWKTNLLLFGSPEQLNRCKDFFTNKYSGGLSKTAKLLTATPLDYHVFRQELISKYPSYIPPAPLVPFDDSKISFLPPLSTLTSRATSHEDLGSMPFATATNQSAFDHPVHIATPIPSPPPSPAGPGGKGGKKQNYQTNQNFPFLYPPTDPVSMEFSATGPNSKYHKLLQARWKSGDVPAAILEAGDLFASRMRMSRSLRQLWVCREQFAKSQRRYKHEKADELILPDLEELDLEELSATSSSEPEQPIKTPAEDDDEDDQSVIFEQDEIEDTFVASRLGEVAKFYENTLSSMQSMVIVLLKTYLTTITTSPTSTESSEVSTPLYPSDGAFEKRLEKLPEENINLARQVGVAKGEDEHATEEPPKSVEEINAARTKEVTAKAILGVLLNLLKWFKLSHVLRYDYLLQLLLDSNFVPLALKHLSLQNVETAVSMSNTIEELSLLNRLKPDFYKDRPEVEREKPADEKEPQPADTESEDEAMPPPIRRHPRIVASQPPPEVDELGYPVDMEHHPTTPLTSFAPRFFFNNITLLRILQKLTKNHAHRSLLLVLYKSSTILLKTLKVPQHELRLYTLKLFKSQVPFCGRKWRSANMKVITAIYVQCKMTLRDEWISGIGAADEVVDSSQAVEQAWRSLVAWWHSHVYKDNLIFSDGKGKQEDDFFLRELEKMGWTAPPVANGYIDDEEDEIVGANAQERWDMAMGEPGIDAQPQPI